MATKEYMREYYSRPENRERKNKYQRERRLLNHDQMIENDAKYRNKLRVDVISAYGNKCKCCGEDRLPFLQLDHKNDDGNKHRKEVGRTQVYIWARKNDYPDNLQVLCANCNTAKRFGICPHRDSRKP